MIFDSGIELSNHLKRSNKDLCDFGKDICNDNYDYFKEKFNKVVDMLTIANVNIYDSYIFLEFLIKEFNHFCYEEKRKFEIQFTGYELELMLNIHKVKHDKMDCIIYYLKDKFYDMEFAYNLIIQLLDQLKTHNDKLSYKVIVDKSEMECIMRYERK